MSQTVASARTAAGTRFPSTKSALLFNSDVNADTRVTLTTIAALNTLPAVTVEAWVYLYNYPLTLASKVLGYIAGNAGYQMTMTTAGVITFNVGNGTTNVSSATTTATLTKNTWHKVEGVWDGSNVYMFIDGVATGAAAALSGGTTGSPAATPYIGNVASARAWTGIITELRISKIARHTAGYTPETSPFTTDSNTVGLYHFLQGTGTTLTDSSSQANHGTLAGTPNPTWVLGRYTGTVTARSAAGTRLAA